jgi:hypothetical protein
VRVPKTLAKRQENDAGAGQQQKGDGRADADSDAATQTDAPRPARYSEDALALQFVARHGDELRYVAAFGQWMHAPDARWQIEDTLRAFDMARAICRETAAALPVKAKKLKAVVTSPRPLPPLSAWPRQTDLTTGIRAPDCTAPTTARRRRPLTSTR